MFLFSNQKAEGEEKQGTQEHFQNFTVLLRQSFQIPLIYLQPALWTANCLGNPTKL